MIYNIFVLYNQDHIKDFWEYLTLFTAYKELGIDYCLSISFCMIVTAFVHFSKFKASGCGELN